MRNSAVPNLPSSSRYIAAKNQIIDLATGAAEDGVQRMATETFAEKVVGDVLGGANGKIWRGAYSSATRVSFLLMPMGVLVCSLSLSLAKQILILGCYRQDRVLSKDRGLDLLGLSSRPTS